MRIVVSGTHASGKSTLISDFAMRHPGFAVLPDPFELVDESADAPDAALFAAQLVLSADRLTADPGEEPLIAERGPLDFLAYLIAEADLAGRPLDPAVHDRASARAVAALRTVDILVVLPLVSGASFHVGTDEHPELREAMNDVLLDLIEDPDLTGERASVVEIAGSPQERLAALEAAVERMTRRATTP